MAILSDNQDSVPRQEILQGHGNLKPKDKEKAGDLERFGDAHELQSDSSPRQQVFGTLHPTSQLRIVLQNLLSRIFFEGSLYTCNLAIPFSFPMTGFASGWFLLPSKCWAQGG